MSNKINFVNPIFFYIFEKQHEIKFMKKILLLLLVISVFSCNDRGTETETSPNVDFCKIERVFSSEIKDLIGQLVYLEDKKKYAIKNYPSTPTIDEVTFYILCDKPENINLNDSVKFSCKSYKFNENENYNSAVSGTEFYFVTNLNIIKL
ncbi:hypothetical protein EIB75_00100 [Epilithonimonas vandammei]|uniref:Uncharacterized protein n=2 Tax=Epilithonimonas TaxID=2782229 RepID=A0A3G8Z9V2_9FLAO|nr:MULTISPECIES: hypothetical protein [Epilithonimonas]AZI53750.1 hypothetical protein EIB75_00100 [Epilithonimonas vandammei]REC70344.1 hypothetical protein DRF58_10210 [Epilithonimonas hispanica]